MDPIERRQRAIRLWLYAVAALIFAMVLVGGATRLTEFRAVDRRMEAGDRHVAADQRGRVAGRVRQVQDHSAVPAAQQRDDASRVQDDLLVGVDAPADGAADRRRVSAAVPVVSGEGLDRAGPALAAMGDLRPRRAARRGRLVDGRVGARPSASGLAIPAGDASDSRLRDLRGRAVDGGPHARSAPRSRSRRASARPRSRCSRWCSCRSISARWSRVCGPG